MARELTNFPNGDGCADVDEGVTDIEAMEYRLTWVMGGCTSSKEETENGEEREEMHVASGWRVLPHKGIRKEGRCVGKDGTQRKGGGYLILFAKVIIQGRVFPISSRNKKWRWSLWVPIP